MRLGQRHARLESREHLPRVDPVGLPRGIEAHGDDRCRAAAPTSRKRKSGGMMPTTCDDGRNGNVPLPPGESIESSRPSAASSPPKRRCQNACERMTGAGPSAAGPCSCFREPTSAHRLHAERLKRAVRDSQGAHALRLAAIGQRRGVLCHRPTAANVRFSCRYVRCMFVLANRSSGLRPGGAMPDPHELLGVRIRQRLDQHRVDDAEDRGRRADAEREREHGGQRERGPPRASRAARSADRGRRSRTKLTGCASGPPGRE